MRRAVLVSAWIVFAVVTAWVAIEGALPYDRRALVGVHDVAGADLDDAARVVARGATAWVLVPLAVVVVAVLLLRHRWGAALLVAAAALLVWVVNPVVKQLVRRDRPDVRSFVEPVSEFSFPSGHGTAAMAAAFVAVFLAWDTRGRVATMVIAGLYVGVIAATQLVLGVHFPSDLVASTALAIAFLNTVVWALDYWRVPGATTPDS